MQRLTQKEDKMKSWKGDRVSLRCLLFCFFGGVGCLFPYLPMHMQKVGLTQNEPYIISIVAPLVAALGPLLVSPLADRMGGAGGRSLRIMLAIVILISAVCYPLLMCIPHALKVRESIGMNFVCGLEGADILQKCSDNQECYDWPDTHSEFVLHHCRYDCNPEHTALTGERMATTLPPPTDYDYDDLAEVTLSPYQDTYKGSETFAHMKTDEEDDQEEDEDEEGEEEGGEDEEGEEEEDGENERRKRDIIVSNNDTLRICFKNNENHTKCHIYTKDSRGISVQSTLLKASKNGDYCEGGCKYIVNGNFTCRIPEVTNHVCKVVCNISPPVCSDDDKSTETGCQETERDSSVTFWSYLLVRSIADIFPTTAIGLLDAAIVIATCETNLGHGDVGRELAFGSLGFAIFAPIVGILNSLDVNNTLNIPYVFSFISFSLLMIISMLILLFGHSMPLSRPEWWSRHARVMPLGGIKRHLSELTCLVFILVILGILWSGIDSFLPWHLNDMDDMNNTGILNLLLGLTLTVGSLPAIPVLWNSERVVEFCGHTNLLIIAFIFYIIRYTAYSYMQMAWWALASEALEVFTMSVLWVTVISYMRQLVPRHLTVTSQGMAVFFHFCLGRCFGAVFAALLSTYTSKGNGSFVLVYQVGAVVSAVVASIYFTVYHCCLKWFCQPVASQSPQDQQEVLQGPTSNGTYTPLRIYHNGSGQKEQLSY